MKSLRVLNEVLPNPGVFITINPNSAQYAIHKIGSVTSMTKYWPFIMYQVGEWADDATVQMLLQESFALPQSDKVL